MKKRVIKLISVLLACITLISTFSGTLAFAYAPEENVDIIQQLPKNGWNDDKTVYYINDVAVTGFYTIDNCKYYFDPENGGIKVTGLQTIDGNIYLFAESGEMLYGWQSHDDAKYYFDETSGAAKKGLTVIDGGRYYFDTETAKMQTGWKTVDNSTYYFSKDTGAAYTGLQKIGNSYYFFSNDSRRVSGWKKIGKDYYFFGISSGKAVTGFKKIYGSYYFFKENGKRITGWKKVGNSHYFFGVTSGKAAKGFKKIYGSYYYFASNAKRTSGWKNIGKFRYFFGITSGKAVKGFKKIYGSYYYFNKNARMQTGWKTVNGYKYYFNPKKGANYGKAVTKSIKINGHTYNFDKYGHYISAQSIMIKKANNMTSKTNYLVLVNKNTHKVGIFTGKKGNWKMVKYYTCTIGAPATPTPTGTFTLGPSRGMPYHQLYFDSGAVRCWYASRILGGYNFHSVLYSQASKPTYIVDPTLGANLSHGCIRLHINNAKWFYDHVPSGTKCVIYNK